MSARAYSAYRQSGVEWVGLLPESWSLTALKHVVAMQSGEQITAERIEVEGAFPVYGGNGLRGFTDAFTHEGDYALIGRQGALCGNINFASGRFWASEHAVVCTPKGPHNVRWLGELLRAMELGQYSVTAAQPGLSVEAIGNLRVPVPPRFDQVAIGFFLYRETGKIDALVGEQERLIALLKEKRQAVISQSVTKGLDPTVPMKHSGVEWLGEVPTHWSVGALKHYWRVIDCKHLTAEFVPKGLPLASIREVGEKFVSLDSAQLTTVQYYDALIEGGRDPRPGDLILSRNATVGQISQVASWHPPFAMGQDVCLLRSENKHSSSTFMQHIMSSNAVLKQLAACMIGSTFKRVNVEQICNLAVVMPPFDEQSKIAEVVDDQLEELGKLQAEASRAISLLRERRAALIAAAVTGKIDVREHVDVSTAQAA